MPRLPEFRDRDFDYSTPERETSVFSSSAVSGVKKRSFLDGRRPFVNAENTIGTRSDLMSDVSTRDAVNTLSHDVVDDNGISDWPRAEDNRRTSPVQRSDRRASSVTGALARIQNNRLEGSQWLPVFGNPASALPCVDRRVKREVMFAKKKAGRAYRTRKRRSPYSSYRC